MEMYCNGQRMFALAGLLLASMFLFGCGGSSSSSPTPTPPPVTEPPPPPPSLYSVGGSVSGLRGSGFKVAVSGTELDIDEDGSITFLTDLDDGAEFAVTIVTQPTAPHQLCSVANGSGVVAGADVSNIAIECVNGLRLAGQVTDQPIPNATVTVKIGDEFYTTVADDDGFFAIVIPVLSDAGTHMVTTEAVGTGNQAHVTFASILGSLSALAATADDDGNFDEGGHNITNVTTAQYVLVVQANNGEVPSSDEELQLAERTVDASAIFTLAAAIKLIVDDPEFELPEGSDSVLAFASNPTAVAAFVAATDPDKLEQAKTDILADTALVPGFKASTLQSEYFVIAASAPSLQSRQAHKLELYDDGSGLYMEAFAGTSRETAFEWELDDGLLRLRLAAPETPIRVFFDLEFAGATPAQVDALAAAGWQGAPGSFRIAEQEYQLLGLGSLVSPVRQTNISHYSFEEFTVDGVTYSFPDKVTTGSMETELWNPSVLPDQPFTAEMVVGQWATYLYYETGPRWFGERMLPDFAHDLVTFRADGTATARAAGVAIGWTITDDGALVLEYGGITLVIRILDGDMPVLATFVNLDDGAGRRGGIHNVMVKRDPTLLEDLSFLVTEDDEYWHGYVNNWRAIYWDGAELNLERTLDWLGLYGFHLDADGAARMRNLDAGPNGVVEAFNHFHDWSVDDEGNVRIDYVEGGWQFRVWQPIAIDQHGYLHVIEEHMAHHWEEQEFRFLILPRGNVYRKEPVPQFDE